MPNQRDLTSEPVASTLLLKSLPMIGGLLSTITFHIVDTYFVSRLGEDPLAAIGFSHPVAMLVFSFAIGMGSGTSSSVSKAIGQGNRSRAVRLSTDSLLLAAVVGTLVMIGGLAGYEHIFRLLGAGSRTMPYVRPFMTVWLSGVVPLMILMLGNNCLQAAGDTRMSGLVMVIGAGLNAVLDPVLIFGVGGFEGLGIAGAATATVISRTFCAGLTIMLLWRRHKLLSGAIVGLGKIWSSWKSILYIGIPSSTTTLLFPFSMGVVTRLIAGYGPEPVAAAGAGQQVVSFVMVFYWSTSWVLMPFVGQNQGAGRLDRVDRARQIAAVFAIGWGLIAYAGLAVLAGPIASIFAQSPDVHQPLMHYLWLVPAGVGFRGLTVLACAFLNGLHRPILAAAVDIVRMFVLTIPMAWAGSLLFQAEGVFGGLALSNILAGVFALLLMKWECRRCR